MVSAQSKTFEAFLGKWRNERIQPVGAQRIEPAARDRIVAERASELVAHCRESGNSAQLVEVARSFGGVEDFVRHLIQASDAQGSTLRPTARDKADDQRSRRAT